MRVFFNSAQVERPAGLTVEDYDARELFEVEVQFEQQGTGKWARWTAAIVKFRKPEQRGKAFRWTLVK